MREIIDDDTRIRFTDTLTCRATGEHPPFIFCRAGDGGRIEHHVEGSGGDRYSVYWDDWHKPFLCDRENFVVEGEEPCRVPFRTLDKGTLFFHNRTVLRKVVDKHSVGRENRFTTFKAEPVADRLGPLPQHGKQQTFGDDALVSLDIPDEIRDHVDA